MQSAFSSQQLPGAENLLLSREQGDRLLQGEDVLTQDRIAEEPVSQASKGCTALHDSKYGQHPDADTLADADALLLELSLGSASGCLDLLLLLLDLELLLDYV